MSSAVPSVAHTMPPPAGNADALRRTLDQLQVRRRQMEEEAAALNDVLQSVRLSAHHTLLTFMASMGWGWIRLWWMRKGTRCRVST